MIPALDVEEEQEAGVGDVNVDISAVRGPTTKTPTDSQQAVASTSPEINPPLNSYQAYFLFQS